MSINPEEMCLICAAKHDVDKLNYICSLCIIRGSQRWIRVKEQLPKDGSRVLAYNGEMHLALINDRAGPGIGMIWGAPNTDSWGLRNVTHWTYLPENPNEVDSY